MTEDTNIFSIVSNNTPPAPADDLVPVYEYVITDTQHNEHFASGFLLFTSQHIAVMRDTPRGALPIFVMPLSEVYCAELLEDDDEVATK